MQDNYNKQRTSTTLNLPSADVDFLAKLQKFIEREAERRQRVVPAWVAFRIDGAHQCVIESESCCRFEFGGGTSKVEIVGRDAEGDVVIATYLPTYDGPKTEVWNVSLRCGDEVSCTLEYDDEEFVHVEAKRIVKRNLGETRGHLARTPRLEFFEFDRAYVERLRDGDAATEHHFAVYFERLLSIKLRSRFIRPDKVEDLKQETFIRVISAVQRKGAVRQPERFGAFVMSVCNDVLLEYHRTMGKSQAMVETRQETPEMAFNMALDLEGKVASEQSSERMRKILAGLPARDRDLLRAVLLRERDQDAVCREFGVDREYVGALVHRAKEKLRSLHASLSEPEEPQGRDEKST